MEKILSISVNSDSNEWVDVLTEFNANNSMSTTFVDKYGLEVKEKVFNQLITKLKLISKSFNEQADTKAALKILETLRLLFRELAGTESTSEEENLKVFMEYANLDVNKYPPVVEEHAFKCFVNMFIKVKPAIVRFVELQGPQKVARKFKEIKADQDQHIFALSRIVFQLALDKSIEPLFNSANLVRTLSKLLKASLKQEEPITNVTHEILRDIFALTMHLGPLDTAGQLPDPTASQLEDFKRLVPSFHKILLSKDIEATHPAKISVINCLVNTPKGCTEVFLTPKVLEELVSILTEQLQGDESSAAETLTPTLLVLTNIVKNHEESKKMLKDIVFPYHKQPDVMISVDGPQYRDTIAGKLRKYITSANVALKYYVQEFIFQLCNEDAQEFVRLIGVGDAAGLLMERKLFGALMGGSGGARVREIQSSNEEGAEEDDDSFDSEEERELNELAEKIERLQKLGVIKMVR